MAASKKELLTVGSNGRLDCRPVDPPKRMLLLWEEVSVDERLSILSGDKPPTSDERRNALWERVGDLWYRIPVHASDAARFRAMK